MFVASVLGTRGEGALNVELPHAIAAAQRRPALRGAGGASGHSRPGAGLGVQLRNTLLRTSSRPDPTPNALEVAHHSRGVDEHASAVTPPVILEPVLCDVQHAAHPSQVQALWLALVVEAAGMSEEGNPMHVE